MSGRIITLCLLLSTMNSVPSIAQKKLANYPKNILYFGHGGGFVGIETSYALLESGDLYKKKGLNDEYAFVTRLRSDDARQIFTNYQFLGLSALQLNEPGNTYSFIEFSNSTEKHRLTWSGQGAIATPGNLKLFYSLLQHFVQNQ